MTSRRDFLKLSAASLAAALPSPFGGAVRLGRVTTEAAVRQLPNPDSRLIRTAKQDDIVSILGELTGIGELSHNSIWFTLADGYIYSSWVQPVEQVFNLPLIAIPATGVWAEVSLPFTDARSEPREDAEIVYRLYYSAIFQVVARVDDAARGCGQHTPPDDRCRPAGIYRAPARDQLGRRGGDRRPQRRHPGVRIDARLRSE
ncbi:MAG: twin-arginine translocation signal domain-containing protein, partial [Chloroflexi bacterium]|nr:twin-arginine translocation signal domain-containing protein [Chloroflexota bacterium]